nr:MAG TPA: hypothetical protein [Caudoviricetes sp.]
MRNWHISLHKSARMCIGLNLILLHIVQMMWQMRLSGFLWKLN